ncbi:MAG: glycosyltransferase family 39 protein [Candidatus Moranbacteria bacterium]|nr:glycosyltransferase family 39 protein [Candidatus Moranbacteria bacterium]
MQTILLKVKPLWLNISLTLSITIILIHKIDLLNNLRFLNSLKIFYLLFLISLFGIIFLKLLKVINNKSLILHTLPTQIILFIGIHSTENLHYIFNLLVGIWLIFGGILIVKKITKQNNHQKSYSKSFTKQSVFFLILIISCQLFFALYQVDKALYIDEKLWTYSKEKRIEKYWNNIFEQDWKNTRPSDKPGVTLAIISGIGLFWETPSDFLNIEENNYSKDEFLKMLFRMRLPVILFASLNLIIFYFLFSKLFNNKTGLLTTTLIGLSPLLIGISRVINPDAFSWILMSLTIITYFIYQKNNKPKYLYATGILLGLSLLTKYIANLLIPFFLAEIFIQTILFNVNEKDLPKILKKKFLNFIEIIILALITFYILYPGTWVALDRLLKGTLWSQAFEPFWKPFITFIFLFTVDLFWLNSKFFSSIILKLQKFKKVLFFSVPTIFTFSILFTLLNVYTQMSFINFEYFIASPKSAGGESLISVFFSGFYSLIFGITPLVFFGLLLTLFFVLRKIKKNKNTLKINFQNYFIWQILFFIFIFYLSSAFSEVVPMVRYQIIIYPLTIILATLGYTQLFEMEKLKNFSKKIFPIFLLFVIFTNCFILWNLKPNFFSYNSFLLPKKYIINPKDIGDGNYEVAQFLNKLPNAKNLKIWSDKNGICNLFIGKCYSVEHPEDFEFHGPDYDYFVISRGRKSKIVRLTNQRLDGNPDYELRLDRLYFTDKILKEFNPGNRKVNFIRVIESDDVKVWEK